MDRRKVKFSSRSGDRFRLTAAAFSLLTVCSTVHGQVLTGEIDGTVRDATGAVIPNAIVTVTNSDQHLVERTVKTDKQGQFTAPLLTIGNYLVSVTAPGFQTSEVTDIAVHVGQPSAIQVSLGAGGANEQIEVTASSVAPQLDTAAAGTLIDATQVEELPLSSRNFTQLLTIQPGITSGIPGAANERGNIQASGAVNTQNFSVNGNPNTGNGFYLDGADTLKRAGQQPVTFPGIDFIQEISLQRASYGAEFGGPGSSVTSVQTKAGTTTIHGGAFFFFRSQALNADTYFNKLAGLPRQMIRANDYGFYLGGPVFIPKLIGRNSSKTFFFFGQEYLRSRQGVLQNISNVPTLAQRQGTFLIPVCTGVFNGTPSTCVTTKQITKIDPTAQAYLTDVINKIPLPNNPSDPQGLIYNSPGDNNETQTLIRVDHQFNSKLSVFFRYLDDPFNLVVPNGFQQTSSIPGVATSRITNGSTNWLGHITYVIGNNHVIELGGATRTNWVTVHSIGLLTSTNATDVAINLPFPNVLDHLPRLAIGASNYNVSGPYDERSPVSQIFVNSTNSYGRHTVKVGANVELQSTGSTQGVANAGAFTFTAANTPTGTNVFTQAFAQFLQGRVSNFTQANKDVASASNLNIYEGYLQDDFKVNPQLTVLGGVRYTYFAAASNAQFENRPLLPVLNFLPSAYNSASAPTLDTSGNICTTSTSACAGGRLYKAYDPINGIIIGGQNSPYGTAVAHGQLDNIQPRFGFTLDPFKNGTTSVRGGYGLYYFSQIGNPSKFATNQDPPNVATTTIQNPSFANPGNGVASFSSTPSGLQGYQAESHSPYTETFSLDVQQQLHQGTVLDIGYYGNHGVHLFADVDINQPLAGAGSAQNLLRNSLSAANQASCTTNPSQAMCFTNTAANSAVLNQIRPYAGYSYITYSSLRFKSHYNSLQASLRERYRNGSLLTLNYTWSKALTNARTPQDNNNLAAEYGSSGNDRRHVFNASFVYPVPFFRKQNTLMGRVAGGYQLSGIVAYGSGLYSTATIGAVDPGGLGLLAGGPAGARPDQVGNPNQVQGRSFGQWFNTAAFTPTPAGQFRGGNAPVQNILGPGYGVWNLTVAKNVRLYERAQLQLRAEAYNAFNHTNFNNISTVLGSTNYGQVTSTGEPRTMQLSGKIIF